MALYADENFPLRVIEELRRLGHDVLTTFEDGKANQSITDQDILARATELDRTIVTLNRRDFKRLHAHVRPMKLEDVEACGRICSPGVR